MPERPRGEASLRGHLRGTEATKDKKEESGSSAYVPEDKTKDVQLKAAIDLLNGVKVVTNVKPKDTKPSNGSAATPGTTPGATAN